MILNVQATLVKSFDPQDLQVYLTCFNDGNWRENYGILTASFDPQMFVRSITIGEYRSVFRYMIYADGSPVGFAHLHIDSPQSFRGVLSGGIRPDLTGRGIGRVALHSLLRQVFGSLTLNKVVCESRVYNRSSQKLLERFHFKQEGYLRQHQYDERQACFHDVIVYGLLRADYESDSNRYHLE